VRAHNLPVFRQPAAGRPTACRPAGRLPAGCRPAAARPAAGRAGRLAAGHRRRRFKAKNKNKHGSLFLLCPSMQKKSVFVLLENKKQGAFFCFSP